MASTRHLAMMAGMNDRPQTWVEAIMDRTSVMPSIPFNNSHQPLRERTTDIRTTASSNQCAQSNTPVIRSKVDQMLWVVLTPQTAAKNEAAT